jgi:hypothetical protein
VGGDGCFPLPPRAWTGAFNGRVAVSLTPKEKTSSQHSGIPNLASLLARPPSPPTTPPPTPLKRKLPSSAPHCSHLPRMSKQPHKTNPHPPITDTCFDDHRANSPATPCLLPSHGSPSHVLVNQQAGSRREEAVRCGGICVMVSSAARAYNYV